MILPTTSWHGELQIFVLSGDDVTTANRTRKLYLRRRRSDANSNRARCWTRRQLATERVRGLSAWRPVTVAIRTEPQPERRLRSRASQLHLPTPSGGRNGCGRYCHEAISGGSATRNDRNTSLVCRALTGNRPAPPWQSLPSSAPGLPDSMKSRCISSGHRFACLSRSGPQFAMACGRSPDGQ